MNESKLMSYITSDFASKSDMRVGAEEWQKIIEEMLPKFKKLAQSDKLLVRYGIKRVFLD